MEKEDWMNYNLLQYDRIDKLETKRENFCNYVLTLTSAIYTIGFVFLEKIDFKYAYVLIVFIILLNFTSIIFNWRTRSWIKLHQMRASLIKNNISQELSFLENKAKEILKKKYESKNLFRNYYYKHTYRLQSDGDIFRRSFVYSALHWIIIGFSIFSLFCITKIDPVNKKLKIEISTT